MWRVVKLKHRKRAKAARYIIMRVLYMRRLFCALFSRTKLKSDKNTEWIKRRLGTIFFRRIKIFRFDLGIKRKRFSLVGLVLNGTLRGLKYNIFS